jgi:glycosyltransferase involved in cell wall biosynthesis
MRFQENTKVSIAIPSYNEWETITQTIDQTLKVTFGCDREVIVVDDESTDGSYEAVGSYPDVKLIRNKVNRGKGAAIRSRVAPGEVFVIQDTDTWNTHLPSFRKWLHQSSVTTQML